MSNISELESYLLSKGAKGIEGELYRWKIQTIAGPLKISIHDSDFTKARNLKKKQVASIYCHFEDVEAAKVCPEVDKGRLNRFSGKYVFHVGQEDGDSKSVWDYCFTLFSYELERILPPVIRNEKIWQECLKWAEEQKTWVESIAEDEWHKTASDLSLKMFQDYRDFSIKELAIKHYDYWKMRAHAFSQDCGGRKLWLDVEKKNQWEQVSGEVIS